MNRIINPNLNEYPKELSEFVHKLTRTHELHPIRLIFNVIDEEILIKHQQKILYTIDRLFEKQLRSKEPNEVKSKFKTKTQILQKKNF